MLAVAVSPHGLTAIRLNKATLSQELCTVGLLQPHILVEYQWQNIGLCHEDSSTTSALATSCRNLPKTSSGLELLAVRPTRTIRTYALYGISANRSRGSSLRV